MIRYLFFVVAGGFLLSFPYAWFAYRGYFMAAFFIAAGFILWMVIAEVIRPQFLNKNIILVAGATAALLIFFEGHRKAYQNEIEEVAEFLKEEYPDSIDIQQPSRRIYNDHIQRVLSDPDASGLTGHFRYLAAVGFTEKGPRRHGSRVVHSSGTEVYFSWLFQLAMFFFAAWVAWKQNYLTGEDEIETPLKKAPTLTFKPKQPSKAGKKNPDAELLKSLQEYLHKSHTNWIINDQTKITAEDIQKVSTLEEAFNQGVRAGLKDEKGTPLIYAMLADRWNIDLVDRLTRQIPDVHSFYKKQTGTTLLHKIAESYDKSYGHFIYYDERLLGGYSKKSLKRMEALAAWMIKNGADINARNKQEQTPLMLFAKWSSVTLFKWLVNQGADIHARDNSGRTPLIYATLGGDDQIMNLDLLIKAGADVKARDSLDKTALHYAARNVYLRSFRRLEKELNEREKSLMYTGVLPDAVISGDAELVKSLTKKANNSGEQYQAPKTHSLWLRDVKNALWLRDTEFLKEALKSGKKYGHPRKNNEPLNIAISYMWPEGLRIILEEGGNNSVYPNDFTSYMALARGTEMGGHMHFLKQTLELLDPLNIPVNHVDKQGCTALDYLTGVHDSTDIDEKEQHILLARYLKDRGADPHIRSAADNKTPVERAREKSLDQVALILSES